MKITSITTKRKITIITFGEDINIAASTDYIQNKGITEGEEISLEEFKKNNMEFSLKYAMEISLKVLSKTSYTEKQLRDKLIKMHIQYEAADKTIEKLKSYNYLNDERYAQYFVSDGINMGKSKKALMQKLKQKGINEEIISATAENYTDEDQKNILSNFIKKQNDLLIEYPPFIRKQKIINKALARGFPYESVCDMLNQTSDNEDAASYEAYYRKKITKRINACKDNDINKLKAKLYKEFITYGASKDLIDDMLYEIEKE